MVTASTIRANAYSVIRTLINNNKVSGSTVINSYPEADPAFPCVIVPMPEAGIPDTVSLGDLKTYSFSIEFSVWATAAQGQAKVAELLDNIQATLEANTTALNAEKIKFDTFSPSRVDKVEVNEQKLYTAGAIATFSTFAL